MVESDEALGSTAKKVLIGLVSTSEGVLTVLAAVLGLLLLCGCCGCDVGTAGVHTVYHIV